MENREWKMKGRESGIHRNEQAFVASNPPMFVQTALTRFLAVVFAVVLSAPVGINCQETEKATIVGTVIGIEYPQLWGWIMHTNRLDMLYVRVDKVLKGRVASRYIRLGYAFNEGSAPELPKDILSGKDAWRFEVSRFGEWDAAVIVSRKEGDWLGKSYPEPNTKPHHTVPITIMCVPVKGFEEEAITLEQRGVIKGYFLKYGNKGPQKIH